MVTQIPGPRKLRRGTKVAEVQPLQRVIYLATTIRQTFSAMCGVVGSVSH
jgi:hypothetical protein